MIRNRNHFLVNSEIYHIDTRQHANFHQLSVNLSKYQKGVYCMVIRCLVLSLYIKIESDNPKKFKFYRNVYMKIPFILWMNSLNFRKDKFIYI